MLFKKKEKKEKKENWQIYAIEVDNTSSEIADFFEQRFDSVIKQKLQIYTEVDKEKIKEETKNLFKEYLQEEPRKNILAVYGSGYFHHLTYGLCSLIDKEYGYIHLDRHSDGYDPYKVNIKSSKVSHNRFVNSIRRDTKCGDCFLIGSFLFPCEDIYKSIKRGDLEEKLEEGLKKLPNDVYLSFDLDVMSNNDITTDFGQGSLRLNDMLRIIDFIQNKKSIIGADILGLAAGQHLLVRKAKDSDCSSTIKPDRRKRGKLLYGVVACKLIGKNYRELKKEFDSTYI